MSWLLERLRKYKDNRGMMATLRCVLVDNKKHRAWPALNRLGIEIDKEVPAYVAGLFATHPEEVSKGISAQPARPSSCGEATSESMTTS